VITFKTYKSNSTDLQQLGLIMPCIRQHFCSLDVYYPGFQAWFEGKVLPGIHSGERSILTAYHKNKIAGISVLKKGKIENKICTFYVDVNYRRNGIGDLMMKHCLDEFNSMPLITVSEELIDRYSGLLSRFGFGVPFVWLSAYRDSVPEYVFDPNRVIMPNKKNGYHCMT